MALGWAVAAVLLLLALSGSPSASAAYLHPAVSDGFGYDGTASTVFNRRTVKGLAYDQEAQRLFVLRPNLSIVNGPNVPLVPQAARGIHAFDMSQPGVHLPIGGGFPIPLLAPNFGDVDFAVDETEGNIYYVEQSKVYGFDAQGAPLGGKFPFNANAGSSGDQTAVDPLGYLWINGHKYDPAGNHIGVGPTGTSITFDRLTDDMLTLNGNTLTRWSAVSGYTEPISTTSLSIEAGRGMVYDAKHGVTYLIVGLFGGGTIQAFDRTGNLIETISPPITTFVDLAFNEETGELYAFNEVDTNLTADDYVNGQVLVFDGVVVPDVTTGQPSKVGHTDATVTGHVDPAGGPGITDCRFQYEVPSAFNEVQTVTLTGATGGTFALVARFDLSGIPTNPIPYNAPASEVQAKLEAPATGRLGIGNVSVTGPAGGPYVVEFIGKWAGVNMNPLEEDDELTPASATVTATTTNDGGPGNWDTAPSVPCNPGAPLESPTDVEADITGLTSGTPYYYRLIATTPNGTGFGTTQSLTPQPSIVKTGAATSVAQTTATLNGTVNPEGLSTTFYFEYGKTQNYGQTSDAPPGPSLGTTTPGDQPASAPISGLSQDTTYHYRLVAVNSNGTSYGVDRTFKTAPAVKHLSTDPASPIDRTTATLNGTLDPDGLVTHSYFEWGRTRRYGSTSAVPPGTELGTTVAGDKQVNVVAGGLKPETTYHFRLVASNTTYGTTYGADRTFTTLPSIKDIATNPATEIDPTAVTLNGALDPDGLATTFRFEWGKSVEYGRTTPAVPGKDVGTTAPGSIPLSLRLEDLEEGTTYHYRIVATNVTGSSFGGDQSFKTPQVPGIEGVFSSNITVSSADLNALINPNGTEPSFETHYRFEYGPTLEYGQSVPVPDGAILPSTSGQKVSVPITGLSEVTYHFRLVAENDWGTVVSEDQTFDFNPPSCPNAAVRQQTGSAYLPDCRAYELVSPARAGGSVLSPQGPSSPYAANRFAFSGFFNSIPNSGDPGGTLYVATRTANGWVTRYVGLSGNEAFGQAGYPGEGSIVGNGAVLADRELSRFLTWRVEEINLLTAEPTSWAPYAWDNSGKFLGRLPTNLDQVPGADESEYRGDVKLSADSNHYVFSSVGTAFAPGGLAASPGSVYDNEIATGTLSVVSKLPNGDDIPKDGLAATATEYIRVPAVSRDGSHILMSTAAQGGTTHLYMRVDNTDSYEVSLGEDLINHGVEFDGMTDDGTRVYFTTTAQMTGDDTDSSADLYQWSENGGIPVLTRLSAGSESSGNGNSCQPSFEWTTGCSVQVVPVEHPFFLSLRNNTIDSAIAAERGDVYFYSPEELDGARGVPGKMNLYIWREGLVRHVATLEPPDRAASRINVSRNGAHMAFVTKTRVTPYDNDGRAQMYTYDPDTRRLNCVSCIPDGSKPTSEVEASQNGNFLTEDGRAFFSTVDPLTTRDANGIRDVYEYVDGRAQLISTGTGDNDGSLGNTPIGLVGVSADGTDVFISTYETLVGQDENGPFLKFYDARVGGGFPFNKPAAPCEAADECHGASSLPPAPKQIGTGASLGEGGNATVEKPKKAKKKKKKKRKKKNRHKRHAGQGGRR